MFPKLKIKASLTRKIVPISLCAVIITAAVKPPVFVYAAEPAVQRTLADFINSYMAVYGGTGNVNASSQSYMATNSIMQAPLEDFVNGTYSVADINSVCSGEAGVARWTSNIANNSQQVSVASAYLDEAGIDSYILDNLTGASVGENLQASIDYYLDHGALKPAFGGQPIENNLAGLAVMQSMADVAYNFDNVMWYARENGWTDEQIDALFDSGAAFGDLQSAVDYVNNFDRTIATGSKVNIDKQTLDNIPVGCRYVFVDLQTRKTGSTKVKYEGYVPVSENIKTFGIFYKYDSQYYYGGFAFVNNADSSARCSVSYYDNGSLKRTDGTISKHNYITNGLASRSENCTFIGIDEMYTDSQAYGNAINTYKAGGAGQLNTSKPLSPDIITNNGQAQGTWTQDANANNRNQFNLNISPNFNPNYNYDVADPTTINNYIQDTQGAIQEGDPQVDIGSILADFVVNLQLAINPNPDPQPTGSPFPTTIPYPTGIPQPNPVPIEDTIPDQPDPEPKPTNTPEEDEKNEQGMATPDLALKFPFCIPFDIADMFSMFMAERRAPQFHIVFDLGSWGEYSLDVDLSPWDEVAALVRLLELIVFIVGLIMVARKLIGDQGG